MRVTEARAPDLATLRRQLGEVLGGGREGKGTVEIVERRPNSYESRFPSDIVVCRNGTGDELTVFCKYGFAKSLGVHGLRCGPAYEADIYPVLAATVQPVLRCYGAVTEERTGMTSLFLQYLDETLRVNKVKGPEAMTSAAHWIASFHRETRSTPGAAINVYDLSYYEGWARRALTFVPRVGRRFPFFESICNRFGEAAVTLLDGELSLIHGEYYPNNVLVRDGLVYPVDWEWAGTAAGEIDLGALTEGWWPEGVVERCTEEYCRARWDGERPGDFPRRFDAARLYLHFRSIGSGRDSRPIRDIAWRFREIGEIGNRLGLV